MIGVTVFEIMIVGLTVWNYMIRKLIEIVLI